MFVPAYVARIMERFPWTTMIGWFGSRIWNNGDDDDLGKVWEIVLEDLSWELIDEQVLLEHEGTNLLQTCRILL